MATTETNFWRGDQQQLSLLLLIQLPTKLVTWWRSGDYLLTTLPTQHCQAHYAPTICTGRQVESNLHSLLGRNRTVTTIVVSARKSGCIVLYRPDGEDMRLLLGQASSIRVFMICPAIDHKKFAPSSCSVTKTIWKDI